MSSNSLSVSLRLFTLIDRLAFILDKSNEATSQEFICDCIIDFFKGDRKALVNIERADISDVKDYIFCLLFNYIDSQIKIFYNQNLFDEILSYYKIWRSGEE